MEPTRITDDRVFTLKDGREVRVEYHNMHPSGWMYRACIGQRMVKEGFFGWDWVCPNIDHAEYLIRQQLEPASESPKQEPPKGLARRLAEMFRLAA